MFTIDDLEKLNWFMVTNKTKRSIEIKSIPTGHYWRLIKRNGYYDMTHRHSKEDNEHSQTSCQTLYDCILYIIGHDEFQMRGRKLTLPMPKGRGFLLPATI